MLALIGREIGVPASSKCMEGGEEEQEERRRLMKRVDTGR